MWRALYRNALNPEAFFDVGYLRALMQAVGNDHQSDGTSVTAVPETARRMTDWAGQQRAEYERVLRSAPDADAARQVSSALLAQSLPMASALGCWLQNLSAPGVFEDEVQLQIMALLAEDVGVGRPEASRFEEFRLLLNLERLSTVAVGVDELASLAAVGEELYALPAVLQALSRRSDEFAFELVGVDYLARSLGMLPCWAALRSQLRSSIQWERLDLGAATELSELGEPRELSGRILAACAGLGPETAERVAAGAAWFAGALEAWNARVLAACRQALDPEQAMAALLRARAREGAVYHQDFVIEGRPLSDWLRQAQQDPLPLLRVLARSKLIKPGNSARSLLVNGLVGVQGRMFRIFSPEDLAVARRWIDHLPATDHSDTEQPSTGQPSTGQLSTGQLSTGQLSTGQLSTGQPDTEQPSTGQPAADPGRLSYPAPTRTPAVSAQQGVRPADLRQAYFLLQGRALEPQTRAFALDYVHHWLELSEKSLDKSGQSLPPEWTVEGLRPWLLNQHDQHDQQFSTAGEELPERDAVIDSSLQLAPLTLIDGSWLQGFTDVHLASSRVGAPLFQTYWDELGNGRLSLNHPKMYRDGLAEMGVRLAPTSSYEFAHDPRLREESLRLPVYWLCLGKFPTTFRPEILGMNLAMELSGVGGSYRSARRFLKHYGFDTRFVDVHNTIDNVSTGHSAWAADAIDTYLRTHPNRHDPSRLAAEWHRVRVGYESLAPQQPKRGGLSALRRSREPFTPSANPDPSQPRLHHPPIRMSA